MSSSLEPVKWHLIQDVQLEITRWADEQFPGRTDHQTVYKLVVHEIPELMVHKKEKGTAGIGTELADCFILLMDLASMWGVDLSEAIRAKMEINYGRIWERDAHGIMQHVPGVTHGPPTALEKSGLVTGVRCPGCNSIDTIEHAAVTSIYLYHCGLCGKDFDDDIPF